MESNKNNHLVIVPWAREKNVLQELPNKVHLEKINVETNSSCGHK